eukprot:scaffold12171_cov61-Phaeocystis_antarctica.AAC.9
MMRGVARHKCRQPKGSSQDPARQTIGVEVQAVGTDAAVADIVIRNGNDHLASGDAKRIAADLLEQAEYLHNAAVDHLLQRPAQLLCNQPQAELRHRLAGLHKGGVPNPRQCFHSRSVEARDLAHRGQELLQQQPCLCLRVRLFASDRACRRGDRGERPRIHEQRDHVGLLLLPHQWLCIDEQLAWAATRLKDVLGLGVVRNVAGLGEERLDEPETAAPRQSLPAALWVCGACKPPARGERVCSECTQVHADGPQRNLGIRLGTWARIEDRTWPMYRGVAHIPSRRRTSR